MLSELATTVQQLRREAGGWSAALPTALLIAAVLQGGPTVIVMHGTSMEPTLSTGDVLVCDESVDSLDDVEEGELVAFEWNGETWVHRAVDHDGSTIVTRGDAYDSGGEFLNDPDSIRCTAEPIAADLGATDTTNAALRYS